MRCTINAQQVTQNRQYGCNTMKHECKWHCLCLITCKYFCLDVQPNCICKLLQENKIKKFKCGGIPLFRAKIAKCAQKRAVRRRSEIFFITTQHPSQIANKMMLTRFARVSFQTARRHYATTSNILQMPIKTIDVRQRTNDNRNKLITHSWLWCGAIKD